MRIRLLKSVSGPGVKLGRGEEAEWDSDDALRMIAAGIAEPAEGGSSEGSEIQTTMKTAPRNALSARGKKNR